MSSTDAVDLEASAFASRIGTNYGATDDDAEQLKELLSSPTAELGKLQEEIDRVSSQLDELYSKHGALFRKVDAHRALMSPIRRMPIDIIQLIFLHCLPTQHNPIMSRHDAPMLLTQVCSGWRRIAHSTPLLWSAIHIVVPCQISNPHFYPSPPWSPPTSHASPALDVAHKRAIGIAQWLGRSAECPLDILVYDRDRATSEAPYEVILDAIIAFSRRWHTIHFQSPSTCLSRVAALSEHDVPMLRSLTIRGQDAPTNQFHPADIQHEVSDFKFLADSGLLKAPQLREIVYKRVTEDFLQFPLKWEQLTVISLTGFAWTVPDYLLLRNVAQALQRCPSLVACTLEIAFHPPPSSDDIMEKMNMQPISLPFLETISLQSSKVDLICLFHALQAPALRELEFYLNPSNFMPNANFTKEVIHFIKRTSCTLKALTMDPFFLDKESLHTCLRLCPGLRSLSLRASHFPGNEVWTPPPQHTGLPEDPPVFTVDDDLLTSFIDAADPLLDHLEAFECTVDGALTDEALLAFIGAKQAPAARAPLKKVAVTLKRPQMLPMASELRRYVKDGLDCRLSYTPTPTHGPYPASDGIFPLSWSGPYRPWGLLSFDDGDTDTE